MPQHDAPVTAVTIHPPPDGEWSELKREAMLRLWSVAGELVDEEATGITMMAEMLASMPLDTEQRRQVGLNFLAGLMLLRSVAREQSH